MIMTSIIVGPAVALVALNVKKNLKNIMTIAVTTVLYKAFFVGFDPAKAGSVYVRNEDGVLRRAYYECVQYAEPPDEGWE